VSVVRDEADIIVQCLDTAFTWADVIHILDNGSTDGTWELLQEYAAREPRLVLEGRWEKKFSGPLRGEVVNQATTDAQEGDWWSRVDADEFIIDEPREILARLPADIGVVHGVFIEYYFTEVELRAYEADPEGYRANWTPDTMRYYTAMWAETRFVRHRPGARWDAAWPAWARTAQVAPERVRFRHFQYRFPEQMERRIRVRLEESADDVFKHEKVASWAAKEELVFPDAGPREPLWKGRVLRSDALRFDARDGHYEID
jgi:glycosyltransferase involved in cell wall biosynthesis